MIVVVIMGIVAAMAIPAFQKLRSIPTGMSYNEQLYHDWCKAHGRTDLTYDEWLRLYRSNLLPAQQLTR